MSKRKHRMANDTTQNKTTNDDRFEVMQQAIEAQSARIAKLESELATANERIAALSVQVSMPVMGIKHVEPGTRHNMKNMTAEGWDTRPLQERLAEEGKKGATVQ